MKTIINIFFYSFLFFFSNNSNALCTLDNAPPGQYIDLTNCIYVVAPPGSYSPGGNITAPISCAVGTFSNVSGSISCSSCPPGKFSSTVGSTMCLDCPAGTFQSNSGSIDCIDCPAGTSQSNAGSVACDDCPPGRFSNTAGNATCLDCPVGTYADVSGSIICINCPSGTTTSGTGSILCDVTLSVSENSFHDSISYYPNPTNDVITFEFNKSYSVINIVITDMFGKKILSKSYLGVFKINLNITTLSSGKYFVKIWNENEQAVFGVLKH